LGNREKKPFFPGLKETKLFFWYEEKKKKWGIRIFPLGKKKKRRAQIKFRKLNNKNAVIKI